MTWLYIWFSVVVLSIVVEFFTTRLISIWFGIGALFAMILSAFGVWCQIQIIVMIVVSVLGLFLLRKPTLKLINKAMKINLTTTQEIDKKIQDNQICE